MMAYHRACVIRNCLIDCEFRQNPVPIASISLNLSTCVIIRSRLEQDLPWVQAVAGGGKAQQPGAGSPLVSAQCPGWSLCLWVRQRPAPCSFHQQYPTEHHAQKYNRVHLKGEVESRVNQNAG